MPVLFYTIEMVGVIGLAIAGMLYSSYKLHAIWICYGAVVVILFGAFLHWTQFIKSSKYERSVPMTNLDGISDEVFHRLAKALERTDSHEPKGISKLILDFTKSYWGALEEAMDKHGRDFLAAHGDKVEIVSVFQAKDGFVTFYLPVPPDRSIKRGLYFFDAYAEHTLDEICQSLSPVCF